MTVFSALQMAKRHNAGSEGIHVAAAGAALPLHCIL